MVNSQTPSVLSTSNKIKPLKAGEWNCKVRDGAKGRPASAFEHGNTSGQKVAAVKTQPKAGFPGKVPSPDLYPDSDQGETSFVDFYDILQS